MDAIPAIFPVSPHFLFVCSIHQYAEIRGNVTLKTTHFTFRLQSHTHTPAHTHIHTIYPHTHAMGPKWLKKY